MYIDINAISYLDLNIFHQNECFCSKLGMEVEHAKPNLKTSLSQIWVICHLLPFVRVWQHSSSSSSFIYFAKHEDILLRTSSSSGGIISKPTQTQLPW